MPMSITEASRELYLSLRNYNEVVGTGVVSKNNTHYIVVYLEKASKAILAKIPTKYKGNSVKTEISDAFYGF